ncbi:hypothetical protein [Actinacidiphila yeochonensis]|uniref:hypothetical protein n=1 Tax=Actinacidiphila yeochonensis TaxID=89050 RepID=UPI000560470F|nr:hypothetical protein [Actinacidiphila yeochonensis]
MSDGEVRPLGGQMAGLLEFSGVGPERKFSTAFPADVLPGVLTRDPLAGHVEAIGAPERVPARAAGTAGPGPARVRPGAARSAASLPVPVAEEPIRADAQAVEVMAVDPVRVGPPRVRSALRRSAADPGGEFRDDEYADGCPVGDPIDRWIDSAVDDSFDEEARAISCGTLRNGYASRVDYVRRAGVGLRSACDDAARVHTVSRMAEKRAVFGSGARVSEFLYAVDGIPLLLRQDVVRDLRPLIAGED